MNIHYKTTTICNLNIRVAILDAILTFGEENISFGAIVSFCSSAVKNFWHQLLSEELFDVGF